MGRMTRGKALRLTGAASGLLRLGAAARVRALRRRDMTGEGMMGGATAGDMST